MNILILIGVAAIAAAVAIGVYIAVHRAILKGRKEDIIEKAELEAENIKKEKKLTDDIEESLVKAITDFKKTF